MDAKYERMMLEAEVRRQINRESRMAELSMWVRLHGACACSPTVCAHADSPCKQLPSSLRPSHGVHHASAPRRMMERPFSFQERDEERAAFKEAVAAAAKDPKRFQVRQGGAGDGLGALPFPPKLTTCDS